MMNLTKLFEVQKVLRDRINYNEPDRFNKLILALLVELGECANEWRGFKFWSQNQQPRTKAVRNVAMNEEDKEYYNPLLEEYVDGLHFVLEIGIELTMNETWWFVKENVKNRSHSVTSQFNDVFRNVMEVEGCNFDEPEEYEDLIYNYLSLGLMLGFTWEQIEESYLEKNAINHKRQDSGVY